MYLLTHTHTNELLYCMPRGPAQRGIMIITLHVDRGLSGPLAILKLILSHEHKILNTIMARWANPRGKQ